MARNRPARVAGIAIAVVLAAITEGYAVRVGGPTQP